MSKYVIRKRKIKSTKSRDEKVSLELAFETVYRYIVFDVNHLVASSRLLGQHTKRRVLQTSYVSVVELNWSNLGSNPVGALTTWTAQATSMHSTGQT